MESAQRTGEPEFIGQLGADLNLDIMCSIPPSNDTILQMLSALMVDLELWTIRSCHVRLTFCQKHVDIGRLPLLRMGDCRNMRHLLRLEILSNVGAKGNSRRATEIIM